MTEEAGAKYQSDTITIAFESLKKFQGIGGVGQNSIGDFRRRKGKPETSAYGK
jgi:hypothetical protein